MTSKKQLYDNYKRPINYLRLAVTDRCNLRCFYCMPEEGIDYLPKKHLLTYEEMERLVGIMAGMGVDKIRITGGEPFLRKDLMGFLWKLKEIKDLQHIHLTTNGVLTAPFIPELKRLGIASVNLSLDTLDRERFKKITRRDELAKVLHALEQFLHHGIDLKINMVVMEGQNTDDIQEMVALTKNHPISVRFIEEMPFNGSKEGPDFNTFKWSHKAILQKIREAYPELVHKPTPAHSTASLYGLKGHQGDIGIIAAFSRTFCGTCNRIRMTAQGTLKTCLYDDGVLDVKQAMRAGTDDSGLAHLLQKAFQHRAKNGFEAENKRAQQRTITESMSSIGG